MLHEKFYSEMFISVLCKGIRLQSDHITFVYCGCYSPFSKNLPFLQCCFKCERSLRSSEPDRFLSLSVQPRRHASCGIVLHTVPWSRARGAKFGPTVKRPLESMEGLAQ